MFSKLITSITLFAYSLYLLNLPWNSQSYMIWIVDFLGINMLIIPFVLFLRLHIIPSIFIFSYFMKYLNFNVGMFGIINAEIIPSYIYWVVIAFYSSYYLYVKFKNKEKIVQKPKRIKRKTEKTINSFIMPKVSFLSLPKSKKSESISRESLEQVLNEYKVEGELLNQHNGPVVTLFEFKPAPGIKASKIVNLSNDIARSTESLSARISTIPGKNLLGIELPNRIRNLIGLRNVLDSSVFQNHSCNLPLALGCDITGKPIVVDLAQMPHLLVSGTTGSGKSVAMHSMILSLLYAKDPDDCKFILVDPKQLELSVYNGIPHLLTPVVTDPQEAVKVLKWAVQEMERRYRLLSEVEVRNISGFNEKIIKESFKAKSEKKYEKMPYLVVIVDEMADLMMTAGKEIEVSIQRLSQMARAAGIHIIMATQRPSVDVITGTIKSNFPVRITFQLASKIDSRTIMGENSGAEQLLGKGDMLYISPGYPARRIQAPFVSDEEVHMIADFLRDQREPSYIELEVKDQNIDENASDDPMYTQAVQIVLRDQRVSISYIQRQLQIGYNRSARIVESMEEQGIVSKPDRSGKREILV
ncbi:DNA translocase FtsK [Candidatus Cytomitobacter indipagum]|uniref:DNA translocase FtsK n=1 Tax=Candidatus Cytomitobacter indipagum TaxID=2601575 RepID=A0A5C0UEI0_9PROT|nr:DNA translocase FtsK [Candidatus Cytomitobacter indipagum]QEK38169.1 DNA translocase FtsK [Candidatus Cytomitobacter indipagum]